MRPMVLLAVCAMIPDECPTAPSPVRSLFPLAATTEVSCERGLAGAWVREDSAAPESEVWVLWLEEDPSDSTCALTMIVTDSGIARTVLDTLELAWIDGDSGARAALAHDRQTRKQFRRDSTRLAAVLEDGGDSTLTLWEVRTVRRSGMLFVDLSRDADYVDLMGGRSIRTHWLWQAVPEGDRLTLYRFDAQWLRRMTDSAHVSVAHALIDGEFVLTAPGAEVLALMEQYAGDTAAFPAKGAFRLRR